MAETKTTVTVGPTLPVLLFILFLALKLCDVIDWSWWWVAAPLWLPLAVVLATMLLIGIGVGCTAFVMWLIDRK